MFDMERRPRGKISIVIIITIIIIIIITPCWRLKFSVKRKCWIDLSTKWWLNIVKTVCAWRNLQCMMEMLNKGITTSLGTKRSQLVFEQRDCYQSLNKGYFQSLEKGSIWSKGLLPAFEQEEYLIKGIVSSLWTKVVFDQRDYDQSEQREYLIKGTNDQ